MVSVGGVAMGVGFFIALASLMQGFQSYFLSTVVDVAPHVTIMDEYRTPRAQPGSVIYGYEAAVIIRGLRPKDERRGIRGYQGILDHVHRLPDVAVSTSLTGQVFLRFGTAERPASVLGIVPDEERRITRMEQDLEAGSLDSLQTAPNGIILGKGLADKLGVSMNDSMMAVSARGILMRVKVVGLLNTGITAVDNSRAYMLLKKVQILEEKPNRISQINLRLANPDDAPAVAAGLERQFLWRTESWQEANAGIFGVFVIQNIIMYSTTSAIMIVAAFGIFNIISTIIHEKAKDIAILKSLGFRENDIRTIFVWQGLVVGTVGAVLGWGLGNTFSSALASVRLKIGGEIRTDHLFILWSVWHYVIAAVFSVTAALLASWLPARKAARVNPVEIIRGVA